MVLSFLKQFLQSSIVKSFQSYILMLCAAREQLEAEKVSQKSSRVCNEAIVYFFILASTMV